MTETNNLTESTLPGAETNVPASGGEAAVADTLSLAELNQHLGKDFKDKATALKAVKDTFSFVGKKQETAAPSAQADADLKATVQTLQEQVFYANNPQYKGHESIIKAMGSNPAEVVQGDAFKTYFEKAKVADEVAQTKSVVASNSRIAQAPSVNEEAAKIANSPGSGVDEVAGYFASQLVDAMQG